MKRIQFPSEPVQRLESPRAFTLVELLVVLAVLALLVSLVVPALARTKPNSHRYQCLNNLNQLMGAMEMYAHDNHDFFPPNPDDAGATTPGHHWVPYVASPYNPDIYYDSANSLLTPYLNNNIGVFHCPADPRQGIYSGTQSNLLGKTIPAVRSVSMSGAVGTVCDGFWNCGGHNASAPKHAVNGPWLTGVHGGNGCNGNNIWATFGKTTSFRMISPATVFVLCDENPWIINDGGIVTSADPANPKFVDYPSWLHGGAGGFSFGDGHTEMHKWLGNQLQVSFDPGIVSVPANSLNMVDWTWLAQHSSARNQ